MQAYTQQPSQRGASAIEFGLCLPLLCMLLFGVIEFSVLFYDKAMITNASREGAREGIAYLWSSSGGSALQHPDDAAIAAVVNSYCQNNLITFGGPASVSTAVSRSGDSAGNPLTVRVSYNYDFLVLPNFVTSLTDGINLTAETVMRLE